MEDHALQPVIYGKGSAEFEVRSLNAELGAQCVVWLRGCVAAWLRGCLVFWVFGLMTFVD
jgi:hypothetical protein